MKRVPFLLLLTVASLVLLDLTFGSRFRALTHQKIETEQGLLVLTKRYDWIPGPPYIVPDQQCLHCKGVTSLGKCWSLPPSATVSVDGKVHWVEFDVKWSFEGYEIPREFSCLPAPQ